MHFFYDSDRNRLTRGIGIELNYYRTSSYRFPDMCTVYGTVVEYRYLDFRIGEVGYVNDAVLKT